MNKFTLTKSTIFRLFGTLAILCITGMSSVLLACNNVSNGGEISGNQTICAGELPVLLSNEEHASGGDQSSDIEYLWMSTTQPGAFSAATWTEIPGSTSASYQPTSLYQTTYFIRCSRRNSCVSYAGESGIITVNVLPAPPAIILNQPNAANAGELVQFSAQQSLGASYMWDFGSSATVTNPTAYNPSVVFDGTNTSETITLTVTGTNNCQKSYSYVISLAALPVELVHFRATPTEKAVLLTWQTASETNHSHFLIERSQDGASFSTLAAVEGNKVDSYQLKSYDFLDQKVSSGTWYYRLLQVDVDGKTTYAALEQVHVSTRENDISVYPNPATSTIYLKGELPEATYLVEIINAVSGKQTKIHSFVLTNSTSPISLPIHELQSGMYVLLVKNEAGQTMQSVRFMKTGK